MKTFISTPKVNLSPDRAWDLGSWAFRFEFTVDDFGSIRKPRRIRKIRAITTRTGLGCKLCDVQNKTSEGIVSPHVRAVLGTQPQQKKGEKNTRYQKHKTSLPLNLYTLKLTPQPWTLYQNPVQSYIKSKEGLPNLVETQHSLLDPIEIRP